MPLLPSHNSANPPSSLNPIESFATQPSLEDAALKQAQSYWTANAVSRLRSLSDQNDKQESSDNSRRNAEAEHRRQRWIQVKNRRRRWLDAHPEYFQGSELEGADPLLYDRLVRRFQSVTEREEEGKSKGFAGTIEASLLRGEARIEEARNRQEQGLEARHPMDTRLESLKNESKGRDGSDAQVENGDHGHSQDEDNGVVEDIDNEADIDNLWTHRNLDSKEDASQKWRQVMSARFLNGKDVDFNYTAVDEDSEWDDHEEEERRRMDDWFDDEEPSWGTPGSGDEQVEKVLTGETGVQDY
ncbi:MAG: hypothetical protein M1822_004753 [Bathelium mastoideum]|nr:MAG: hypothetical protein M1822_004753 [Bathelium mastoideum]